MVKHVKNFGMEILIYFFQEKIYKFTLRENGEIFTYLKTPEELQKKLLNFAHHLEFEKVE